MVNHLSDSVVKTGLSSLSLLLLFFLNEAVFWHSGFKINTQMSWFIYNIDHNIFQWSMLYKIIPRGDHLD